MQNQALIYIPRVIVSIVQPSVDLVSNRDLPNKH